MGSFYPKYKIMNLKYTQQLCVITIKKDAKFEEELTFRFKIDMRNLTNFDLSTQKCQISIFKFAFDGLFLNKVYNV